MKKKKKKKIKKLKKGKNKTLVKKVKNKIK